MGLVPGAASSEQVVFDTKIPDLFFWPCRSLHVRSRRFVVVVCLFVCLFLGGWGRDIPMSNEKTMGEGRRQPRPHGYRPLALRGHVTNASFKQ